jgi:hypothetical protein
MDKTGSIALWRKLLSSIAPGEMTVRQWCDRQGVSLHQYYYWRRRIAAVADEKTAEAKPSSRNARVQPWLAVEVVEPMAAPATSEKLTLQIAGAAIDLQPGFDPSLLRAVVRALGADPC